jgi:hypothetical protein
MTLSNLRLIAVVALFVVSCLQIVHYLGGF